MNTSRLQEWAYAAMLIVFGVIILKEGAFLFVPLLWGVFFAFALYPMAHWLELKRVPRALAIVISILVVSVFVIGVLYVLFNQVINLAKDIPEIGEQLKSKSNIYLMDIFDFLGLDVESSLENLGLMEMVKLENLSKTLFATGKSLTLGGIVPLYVFLLMYYKDFFTSFLLKVSNDPNEQVIGWARSTGDLIKSYLVGLVKVTVMLSVLSGIYFYFIGSEYFILFAVLVGVLNPIPYVGVIISSSVAIFFMFLTTDSLIYPLLTMLVLWGLQLFENNIITPTVVGSQVKVNALAVVLAILFGGWLWGVSGMVLCIPLIGVVKLTLEQSEDYKAYGFLLSDSVKIVEENENYWSLLKRRLGIKKGSN